MKNWRIELAGAATRIKAIQRPDGAIPWVEDSVFDPWNHTECAMALDAMGEKAAAVLAYQYLRDTQNADGSWWAGYGNAVPLEDELAFVRGEMGDQVRDTNFAAYPAIGVYRRALQYGPEAARPFWSMVKHATSFVLALQHPEGDFCWSAEGLNSDVEDALITGNASIYMSLGCVIALAEMFGEDSSAYTQARARLGDALRNKPQRFDRNGKNGDRYAMDWYYPALSGALDQAAARARLTARWSEFVQIGVGCRCVSDAPWVTVAESAELAITCLHVGWPERAADLLSWQLAHRDDNGAFWMGYQFEAKGFWPGERPSWTQGAIILAAEAFEGKEAWSNILTR